MSNENIYILFFLPLVVVAEKKCVLRACASWLQMGIKHEKGFSQKGHVQNTRAVAQVSTNKQK